MSHPWIPYIPFGSCRYANELYLTGLYLAWPLKCACFMLYEYKIGVDRCGNKSNQEQHPSSIKLTRKAETTDTSDWAMQYER